MTDEVASGEAEYTEALKIIRERPYKRKEVIGDCTLYLGDCLEVMPTLDSIDGMATDPPYCSGGYLEAQKNTKAQGLRGATVSAEGFKWFSADNMGTAGLLYLLRGVLSRARRLMRPNCSAYVCTDWRMVPTLAPALESGGMRFRNLIVWDKGSAGLGVGFKPAHEIILEFSNGSTEYQALDGQNVIRQNRVPAPQKEHGAQKPWQLMAELVRMAVVKDGVVLDPFMGSGTTGVACVKLGRKFIGIELDEGYFEIACKRIRDAYAQPDFFVEAPKPEPAKQEALI